jgi:hypothetical protein
MIPLGFNLGGWPARPSTSGPPRALYLVAIKFALNDRASSDFKRGKSDASAASRVAIALSQAGFVSLGRPRGHTLETV